MADLEPSMLLQLPRELRDDILYYAILFDLPRPIRTSRPKRRAGLDAVAAVKAPYAFRSLLFTCSQLHHEVLDMFNKHPEFHTMDIEVILRKGWMEQNILRCSGRFNRVNIWCSIGDVPFNEEWISSWDGLIKSSAELIPWILSNHGNRIMRKEDGDATYVVTQQDPFLADLAMLIQELAYPWAVPQVSFLQRDEEYEMAIAPHRCSGGSRLGAAHSLGGVNCCGPQNISPTEAFMHAMYVNILDARPFDQSFIFPYHSGSLLPLVEKIEFISRKRRYELDSVKGLEGTIMFRTEYQASDAELITQTRDRLGLRPAELHLQDEEDKDFWKRFEKQIVDGEYAEVLLKGKEETEWATEPLKLHQYRGTENEPIREIIPPKVFLEMDEYSPLRIHLYPTVKPFGQQARTPFPGETR